MLKFKQQDYEGDNLAEFELKVGNELLSLLCESYNIFWSEWDTFYVLNDGSIYNNGIDDIIKVTIKEMKTIPLVTKLNEKQKTKEKHIKKLSRELFDVIDRNIKGNPNIYLYQHCFRTETKITSDGLNVITYNLKYTV